LDTGCVNRQQALSDLSRYVYRKTELLTEFYAPRWVAVIMNSPVAKNPTIKCPAIWKLFPGLHSFIHWKRARDRRL